MGFADAFDENRAELGLSLVDSDYCWFRSYGCEPMNAAITVFLARDGGADEVALKSFIDTREASPSVQAHIAFIVDWFACADAAYLCRG